jgi:hypothetical protein
MSLKSTLEIIFEEISDNSLECMMNQYCGDDLEIALDNQLIHCDIVESYGGEDQGSDYWCVWKFSKGSEECFVKFHGWYASHYGTDYQGFKFVAPAKKTITVYE